MNKKQTIAGSKEDLGKGLLALMENREAGQRWPGLSDEQKRALDAFFPDRPWTSTAVEVCARQYFKKLWDEEEAKVRTRVIGLCVQLYKKLDPAEMLVHFHSDDADIRQLFRALTHITKTENARRRQSKQNAKQEARADFMESLLDEWRDAGGNLGDASSPMVQFIKAAWPEPLVKFRPSAKAIVVWAYSNEKKRNRLTLHAARLFERIEAAKSASERADAERRMEDFAQRYGKIMFPD